eukprot:10197709-Alexandrium_andersonii.AAC.1
MAGSGASGRAPPPLRSGGPRAAQDRDERRHPRSGAGPAPTPGRAQGPQAHLQNSRVVVRLHLRGLRMGPT